MTNISALLIDSGNGWFDSVDPSYMLFTEPEFSFYSFDNIVTSISGNSDNITRADPIDFLQSNLRKGYTALGYIGYDYFRYLNGTSADNLSNKKNGYDFPQTYFHFYNNKNISTGNYTELSGQLPDSEKPEYREPPGFRSSIKHDEYIKIVKKAREYIASGDIYQVNLSQRIYSEAIKNIISYSLELYNNQPVPYFSYMDFDGFELISGSMELFLERKGRIISSRPIKGTIKRSRDPGKDSGLQNRLSSDPKERAENVMIVDLMRNDLGRICNYGSVNVKKLFDIRTFSTLYQMESEIEGILKEGIKLRTIIESTFPPGSVTGAPKSRCLEIIDELEPHLRGPYCGAVGIFYPDGNFTLSVAIRIVVNTSEKSIYWVGGGIVWDSDPQKEYEETLLKAKAINRTLKRY